MFRIQSVPYVMATLVLTGTLAQAQQQPPAAAKSAAPAPTAPSPRPATKSQPPRTTAAPATPAARPTAPVASSTPPKAVSQRRTVQRPVYRSAQAYPVAPNEDYGRTNGSGYRSPIRPYPPVYRNDNHGYRNPGGVGRFNEYYPPGDRFPTPEHDRVPVARFDGAPVNADRNRSAQLQSQRVGIARAQQIENQIEAFARPFGGLGIGIGVGFGGAIAVPVR